MSGMFNSQAISTLVKTAFATAHYPFAKALADEEALILSIRAITSWSEDEVWAASEKHKLPLQDLYEAIAAGKIPFYYG